VDALIPIFVAVLLSEMGSEPQIIAHANAANHSHIRILTALLCASLLSYGMATVAGLFIFPLIAFDARTMLFGLALMFAGVPMVLKSKVAAPLTPGASLLTFVRKFAVAQFGDGSQFLVLALVAKTGTPALVTCAALAGVIAACLIPMTLGQGWFKGTALRIIRLVCAFLLLATGFWMIVSALKIG
jgi:putative Ca2+/H+ antiporter (TMEM165/GDT1 family)